MGMFNERQSTVLLVLMLLGVLGYVIEMWARVFRAGW